MSWRDVRTAARLLSGLILILIGPDVRQVEAWPTSETLPLCGDWPNLPLGGMGTGSIELSPSGAFSRVCLTGDPAACLYSSRGNLRGTGDPEGIPGAFAAIWVSEAGAWCLKDVTRPAFQVHPSVSGHAQFPMMTFSLSPVEGIRVTFSAMGSVGLPLTHRGRSEDGLLPGFIGVFSAQNDTSVEKTFSFCLSWQNLAERIGPGQIFGTLNTSFSDEATGAMGISFKGLVEAEVKTRGEFALLALPENQGEASWRIGWDPEKDGNDFWEDFAADGALDGESFKGQAAGLCLRVSCPPGGTIRRIFALSWNVAQETFSDPPLARIPQYANQTSGAADSGLKLLLKASEIFSPAPQWRCSLEELPFTQGDRDRLLGGLSAWVRNTYLPLDGPLQIRSSAYDCPPRSARPQEVIPTWLGWASLFPTLAEEWLRDQMTRTQSPQDVAWLAIGSWHLSLWTGDRDLLEWSFPRLSAALTPLGCPRSVYDSGQLALQESSKILGEIWRPKSTASGPPIEVWGWPWPESASSLSSLSLLPDWTRAMAGRTDRLASRAEVERLFKERLFPEEGLPMDLDSDRGTSRPDLWIGLFVPEALRAGWVSEGLLAWQNLTSLRSVHDGPLGGSLVYQGTHRLLPAGARESATTPACWNAIAGLSGLTVNLLESRMTLSPTFPTLSDREASLQGCPIIVPSLRAILNARVDDEAWSMRLQDIELPLLSPLRLNTIEVELPPGLYTLSEPIEVSIQGNPVPPGESHCRGERLILQGSWELSEATTFLEIKAKTQIPSPRAPGSLEGLEVRPAGWTGTVLFWRAQDDPWQEAEIERTEAGGKIVTWNVHSRWISDLDLSPGSAYQYRVRWRSFSKTGPWAGPVVVSLPSLRPFVAVHCGGGTVKTGETVWEEDTLFSGHDWGAVGGTTLGEKDGYWEWKGEEASLVQTGRAGDFSYLLPLLPGTYTLAVCLFPARRNTWPQGCQASVSGTQVIFESRSVSSPWADAADIQVTGVPCVIRFQSPQGISAFRIQRQQGASSADAGT